MEKLEIAVLAVATCLIGVVVGSAVTLAVMQSAYSIPTSGKVIGVGVGVYADSACMYNLTAISWGNVHPSESVNRTVYVKNLGNTPITLSMATSDWVPSVANRSISLTWDMQGVSLEPEHVEAATITLSVSPDVSGITDFSVKITIIGSG